ncbi:DUF397 domain-containing protein [Streptomyces sp. NPDC056465]|uniref:DUF397 domain-containing protein n=1 Tax=Streptomyces sp. NPDC056465 TaxID=3345829 RepID=UPI003698F5BC
MTSNLIWFTSSYGGDQGECVEVAVAWTTSTHSGDQGNCVEVAICPHAVHVRDSKDRTVPPLTLSPATWTAFLGHDWPS